MAVYLIRHGETAWNAARIVQLPDTPLSDRGLEQARRLAARLRPAGVERILVSDYARARQTAEALGRATGAPLTFEPLLRERNLGDLRGRPYAELLAEGIEPFAEGYTPPGGESWQAFHDRVDRAWAVVETAAGERVHSAERHLAVVTHGLVKASVVARRARLGEGVENRFPGGWHNTGLTILEGPSPWTITLLNCGAHLEDPRETAPA